jgi:ankyrin repeat protein
MDRAPDGMRLATACEVGDEDLCKQLVAAHPGLAATLTPDERRKIADAAQENNLKGVRLMLEAGWPVDARGQHQATPLHWAGFNGNLEMTRLLLAHQAPVDIKGDDFDGTPLGWATHGAEHGPHRKTGDHAGTIEALRAAKPI